MSRALRRPWVDCCRGALVAMAASATGCISASITDRERSLPAVTADAAREAWQAARRAEADLQAVRSPVRVELRDARGKRTTLDGALAARDPGDVRLKLWKQGRDVMDLTRRQGQGYVWIDERIRESAADPPTGIEASGTAESDPVFDARLANWLAALAWFVEAEHPRDGRLNDAEVPRWVAPALTTEPIPGTLEVSPVNADVFAYDLRTGVLLSRSSARGQWSVTFHHTPDPSIGGVSPLRTGMTLEADGLRISVALTDPTWNEPLSDALFTPPKRARPLRTESIQGALP